MKVLAIDPGYGRCGVAVLEGTSSHAVLHYSSCIETSATKSFSERLQIVGDEIVYLIEIHQPETIAIEELYFTNNAKTALHVAEVRGMLMYIAVTRKIPLVEYNPLRIKIALTGHGRATKDAVTTMVHRLIKLPSKKMLDDEYDAIALGLTALAEAKYNEVRK